MAITDSFEVKISAKITDEDLKGHIMILKKKSEPIFAITDSGSPMSFLNETTARRLQQNDSSTIFKYNPTVDTARDLACYNGNFIILKGWLLIALEFGDWAILSIPFIVVDDQKANTIGRNQLPQIGINDTRKTTPFIK